MKESFSNFALIGIGGYIAKKHLEAIRHNNCNLIAALDKNDSVGIMDHWFPEAFFFTEFERFDRFIDKLKRDADKKIDYVSICTPNYLHDSHIKFALKSNSNAICEKPLVLNPWNLDALETAQLETGKKIFNILQLRLHPIVKKIKNNLIDKNTVSKKNEIDLTYITSRGNWYFHSWKGNIEKSGGIATNIGIHFFDLLHAIFGKAQSNEIHLSSMKRASGNIEFKNARVRWFLSIDANDLPSDVIKSNKKIYRSINVNNKELVFTDGFEDLHSKSYAKILNNEGFGIDEARLAIETVSKIRNFKELTLKGDYHPMLKKIKL